MSVKNDFPDLPPVWAAGFALAEWGAASLLPIVDFASPASRAGGVMLAAAGFMVAAWAAFWFWRKKTAIEPGEKPTALIVEGPFKIDRNPIYLGITLVLLGIACWLGSLSSVLIALGFPFVITTRFIRREEAALREAFGEEAEAYFRRTRRW